MEDGTLSCHGWMEGVGVRVGLSPLSQIWSQGVLKALTCVYIPYDKRGSTSSGASPHLERLSCSKLSQIFVSDVCHWLYSTCVSEDLQSMGSYRLVNPRHACAAGVTLVGLCACVCLCVHGYSGTTGYMAAYERYQRLQNNECLKNKRQFSRNDYVHYARCSINPDADCV